MLGQPLTPARKVDLRQVVYDKLKEAIVEGMIAPGERLSEIELATKLDVSRTPVREAIRQLSQTGLVTLIPRRGAFVTLPTAKDASDLYDIRMNLEILSISRLCENPPLASFERFRAFFSAVTDDSDPLLFLKEDRRFHDFLSSSSGNRFLVQVLLNVNDLIQLCRHYSLDGIPLSLSASEHLSLIEFIEEGEADQARAVLKAHLSRAKKALLNYILTHPEASGVQ